MGSKSFLVVITVICFFSIPLIIPFVQPGLIATDDGIWAVVRLAEMHRELSDLQIPPRWSGFLNHGYGYPLFLFTYPLPYYLGEIIHLIGLGLVDSIKILFILSIVLSVIAMYIFTQGLWGKRAGLAAALIYIYVPFRITNLFYRGTLGESLAFVFYPLLFYLVYRLVQKPLINRMLLLALVISAFFLVHNISVVLFFPFLGIWVLYLLIQSQDYHKSLLYILGAFCLGLSLSAFFWFPAFIEKKNIILHTMTLANKTQHVLNIRELLGFELHHTTRLPIQIGLIVSVLLLITLTVNIYNRKLRKSHVLILCGMWIFSIIMTMSISLPIWKLPLLKEVDYPWRILGVASFFASAAGGSLMTNHKYGLAISLVCILFLMQGGVLLIKTEPRLKFPDTYYASNDATTTAADELMPKWVRSKPTYRPLSRVDSDEFVKVTLLSETSTRLTFLAEAQGNTYITIKLIYYPERRVFLDGMLYPYDITEAGLIGMTVPKGSHNVDVVFNNTSQRSFADIVSLISIIIVSGLWIYSRKFSS